MDADERFSRATEGPSEQVRQADERSEGTAKRREDRPNRGISQPAQAPHLIKLNYIFKPRKVNGFASL